MKNSGKFSLDSEKIIYIVIVVIFLIFIFNMKNIYNLIADIRTGNLFKKNPVVNNTNNDEEEDNTNVDEEEDEYVIVSPIGEQSIKCSSISSSSTGTKTTNVFLYYTEDQLKSIDEESTYEGAFEEYTNYIYSEQKKYETRKSSNLELAGYSVVVNLTGTLSLTTSSVIDLSKVSLSDIKVADSDSLNLAGTYNQDINEVTALYVTNGYECE